MSDILVVGAGPAGNRTAQVLSTLGHSVTVLDFRERLGDKLCTGVVSRECVDRYHVPPEQIYRSARSAQILPPDGAPVTFERPETQAYVIDRVAFVSTIAERARQAGATYLLGRRVTSIDRQADRVVVHANAAGAAESYEARAVVIASGFGSRLARHVGLQAPDTHAYGSQMNVSGTNADRIFVYAGKRMPAGFFGWVVPTAPGSALVGLLGRGRPNGALDHMLAGLHSEGITVGSMGRRQQWGVPLRPVARSYADRALLVGDAAGHAKPTTGGGIYYSLRTAELAAETLDGCLRRGDLTQHALARYEERWKTLLGRELRIGYLARLFYERLSPRDIERLARSAASNGLLKGELSFDWHADLMIHALRYSIFGALRSTLLTLGSRVVGRT